MLTEPEEPSTSACQTLLANGAASDSADDVDAQENTAVSKSLRTRHLFWSGYRMDLSTWCQFGHFLSSGFWKIKNQRASEGENLFYHRFCYLWDRTSQTENVLMATVCILCRQCGCSWSVIFRTRLGGQEKVFIHTIQKIIRTKEFVTPVIPLYGQSNWPCFWHISVYLASFVLSTDVKGVKKQKQNKTGRNEKIKFTIQYLQP